MSEYEREYGKTKLDHVLSHMTKAFGKFLEFLAILFLPLQSLNRFAFTVQRTPIKSFHYC